MTKPEFISLMKEKTREIVEVKDDKDGAIRSGRRKNTKRTPSHKKTIKEKAADNYEVEEDEEDQKINEEFKGVVRSVILYLKFSNKKLRL